MTLELPKIGRAQALPTPKINLAHVHPDLAGVELVLVVSALEDRILVLEAELTKMDEANELLRRILAEVTKQSIQLGEATNVRPTDQDVKEVWQ